MDKESRKSLARKKLEKTHMVGKGKVDRLKTTMGGKVGAGFTEHIKRETTTLTSRDKFLKKRALQQSISAERDAGKRAAKEAAKRASRVGGKVGKAIGKISGKIPAIGFLAGPAVTLALTGNPQEAMASALDSEDLGAGSDQVGDMGLSRADRMLAERRALKNKRKK